MLQNRRKGYVDYSLIFIILALLGVGLIMVYSTSSYSASISSNTGNNPAYFLRKQTGAAILGLVLMAFTSFVPYHWYKRIAFIGYVVSLILIFLVKSPIGYGANGADRWIRIFGVSLQPAEIAKLAMIIFLATLVVAVGHGISNRRGFWTILLSPLIIALAIWRITSNLSSALIVMSIAAIMTFVASPDYKRFLILGGSAIAAAALLIFVIYYFRDTQFFGFRGARILAWLDPEAYAGGTGYQTLQALYAIGSGGVFGKGIGQSTQKLGFVPEAQNDMIFAIICEEIGFFGGVCIIVLFLLLLWRMLIIATNAPDLYGGLLVTGVMAHIAVQVVFNVAVVTNTIPNTGISLPFISYGGSSVMFLLIEMGIVFNVARNIHEEGQQQEDR